MYEIKYTSQFKKDLKKIKKGNYDIEKLKIVIELLASGKLLPIEYKDHKLIGNYKGHRECHIMPDWLLIYYISDNILVLFQELEHTLNYLANNKFYK